MIYLVDIDGTLADLTHRLHFIEQKPADWDGFFAACPDDEPIQEVIDTVNLLHDGGAQIFLVTGRSDAIKEQTIAWLDSRLNGWHGLYMRKAGDHRQDDIIKAELLAQIITEHVTAWDAPAPILGVFEDRQQVVDMYRSKGLRVFQVAEGKF